MKILIIGTGYVGLVTGVCFAEMGNEVCCLDIDEQKIEGLQRGISPIYEVGLEEMLKRNLASGRLTFTTDYATAVQEAVIFFLALPTPQKSTGACDTSFVKKAVMEIAQYMHQYCLIVNKSTVPIGTCLQVQKWIQDELKKRKKIVSFDVVSNPEFLKEGDAISDFMKPDRIVIGVSSSRAEKLMRQLYQPFTLNTDRLLVMDPSSAEMTKYASNAMLGCRISFMNELAAICEKTGADIQHVRRGMGQDTRIGPSFLYAGVGYGGSCFPKDIKALADIAKSKKVVCDLLDAIESVNERQKQLMAKKVEAYFAKEGVAGKRIAIWGLSFKPGTDDMRQAPSLPLIASLLEQDVALRLFDPIAMQVAKKIIRDPSVYWAKDEFDAVKGADALILMTEWKQFRFIDFSQVKRLMKKAVLFDGRNQYDPEQMENLGFDYFCIGRTQKRAKELQYSEV